jgi:hypothetical protein
MFFETKHRRAVYRLVAADTFEHSKAVLQGIADEMNVRVIPVDNGSIHPNLIRLFH